MDKHDEQDLAQREACAVHAHLQWALYALPRRHPARLMLMLATARADRQRQVSAQPTGASGRVPAATIARPADRLRR